MRNGQHTYGMLCRRCQERVGTCVFDRVARHGQTMLKGERGETHTLAAGTVNSYKFKSTMYCPTVNRLQKQRTKKINKNKQKKKKTRQFQRPSLSLWRTKWSKPTWPINSHKVRAPSSCSRLRSSSSACRLQRTLGAAFSLECTNDQNARNTPSVRQHCERSSNNKSPAWEDIYPQKEKKWLQATAVKHIQRLGRNDRDGTEVRRQ